MQTNIFNAWLNRDCRGHMYKEKLPGNKAIILNVYLGCC